MSVWRIQLPVGHIQLQKGVDGQLLGIPILVEKTFKEVRTSKVTSVEEIEFIIILSVDFHPPTHSE
jgi:hypothetical protein